MWIRDAGSSVLSNEEKSSEVVKKFLCQFPWYIVVIRDVLSSVLMNEGKSSEVARKNLGQFHVYIAVSFVCISSERYSCCWFGVVAVPGVYEECKIAPSTAARDITSFV